MSSMLILVAQTICAIVSMNSSRNLHLFDLVEEVTVVVICFWSCMIIIVVLALSLLKAAEYCRILLSAVLVGLPQLACASQKFIVDFWLKLESVFSAEAQQQLIICESELNNARIEIVALKACNQEMWKKCRSVQLEMSKKVQLVQLELSEKVQSVQLELLQEKSMSAELKDAKKSLLAERSQWKDGAVELKTSLKSAEEGLIAAEMEVLNLKKEIVALNFKLHDQEARHAHATQQVQFSESQLIYHVVELKQNLKSTEEGRVAAVKEVSALKKEIAALNLKLRDEEARHAQATLQVRSSDSQLKQYIVGIKTSLKSTEEGRAAAVMEVSCLKKEVAGLNVKLREQEARHTHAIQQYQSSDSSSKRHVAEIKQSLKSTEEGRVAALMEVSELKKEVAGLNSKMLEKEAHHAQVTRQCADIIESLELAINRQQLCHQRKMEALLESTNTAISNNPNLAIRGAPTMNADLHVPTVCQTRPVVEKAVVDCSPPCPCPPPPPSARPQSLARTNTKQTLNVNRGGSIIDEMKSGRVLLKPVDRTAKSPLPRPTTVMEEMMQGKVVLKPVEKKEVKETTPKTPTTFVEELMSRKVVLKPCAQKPPTQKTPELGYLAKALAARASAMCKLEDEEPSSSNGEWN